MFSFISPLSLMLSTGLSLGVWAVCFESAIERRSSIKYISVYTVLDDVFSSFGAHHNSDLGKFYLEYTSTKQVRRVN
jgi:hypothetical protein